MNRCVHEIQLCERRLDVDDVVPLLYKLAVHRYESVHRWRRRQALDRGGSCLHGVLNVRYLSGMRAIASPLRVKGPWGAKLKQPDGYRRGGRLCCALGGELGEVQRLARTLAFAAFLEGARIFCSAHGVALRNVECPAFCVAGVPPWERPPSCGAA